MYTVRVADIGPLIAVGNDFMALLVMFGWRTGSNEFQFAVVIAYLLLMVSAVPVLSYTKILMLADTHVACAPPYPPSARAFSRMCT